MPSLRLGTTTVPSGGSIDVHVENLLGDSEAEFSLHSDPVVLGSARANAEGVIDATFTVPAGTIPGAHTLVVTGTDADGNDATLSQALTVVAPASAEVPNTAVGLGGARTAIYLGIQALFVAGATAMLVRRGRTSGR